MHEKHVPYSTVKYRRLHSKSRRLAKQRIKRLIRIYHTEGLQCDVKPLCEPKVSRMEPDFVSIDLVTDRLRLYFLRTLTSFRRHCVPGICKLNPVKPIPMALNRFFVLDDVVSQLVFQMNMIPPSFCTSIEVIIFGSTQKT